MTSAGRLKGPLWTLQKMLRQTQVRRSCSQKELRNNSPISIVKKNLPSGYFSGTISDNEKFYYSSCSLKATINIQFQNFFFDLLKSKRTFCDFQYEFTSGCFSDLCGEITACSLFVSLPSVFPVFTWTFVFLNSNNGMVGEYGRRRPRSPKEGIQKLQLQCTKQVAFILLFPDLGDHCHLMSYEAMILSTFTGHELF